MRRALLVLAVLVVGGIALPPLWFAIFPAAPPPDLPPPGHRVVLPGGVGVNVVETGSGPPVLLVHGLPGCAYDWRATSAALAARGRRAIAYDRVGYGHSDPRPDDAFTVGANARELSALLEALNLRDATVVGWSYGGATAMLAAQQASAGASSRIGRLVLVGTGGPSGPDERPPEPSALFSFLYADPVLRWRTAVPPIGVALMKGLSAIAYSGGPQPEWWLAGLRGNLARWETLLTYRGEMTSIVAEDDLDPAAISIPTLLLHGDDDRLADVAIARYLHAQLPDSELVEFPGGSHMLPVTHADAIAERITAFSKPSASLSGLLQPSP